MEKTRSSFHRVLGNLSIKIGQPQQNSCAVSWKFRSAKQSGHLAQQSEEICFQGWKSCLAPEETEELYLPDNNAKALRSYV